MTPIRDLIYLTRSNLKEPVPNYWSDVEILSYLNRGIKDLWRRVVNVYEDHFTTISDAVFLNANTSAIYAVPDDVFRVISIEPRILGQSSVNPGLIFEPRKWQHPDFVQARAMGPVEPRNQVIYWTQFAQGGPVNTPLIRIAPQVTTGVNLTITYNQVIGDVDEDDYNPIPGESDNALVAWATAYGLGKQYGGVPDPAWLQVYATEKSNLATEITPRQIAQPEYVFGMFEGWE